MIKAPAVGQNVGAKIRGPRHLRKSGCRCHRSLGVAVIRRLAKDLAGQLSGGEISASYKTQERTKTPGGGGAQKVQTGNRRFESDFQLWIAADLTDGRKQWRAEERVAGDVHSVASRQQNVID